jgi:hypothetical protein
MSAPETAQGTKQATDPRTGETRTVVPTNRARQGVTGHNARYVLGVGLVAIVVAFAIIYAVYFA